MEKALDLLEKIMPLIGFYPRWVQYIFLITVFFILTSIFLFIGFYLPTRKNKENANISEPPIEIKVSMEQNEQTVSKLFSELGYSLSTFYTNCILLRQHLLIQTEKRPNVQEYLNDELTP